MAVCWVARPGLAESFWGKDSHMCRVRELEKARFRKNETSILQEQVTFNEARRGSSQISELLH